MRDRLRIVVLVIALALAGLVAPVGPHAMAAPEQDWLPLSGLRPLLNDSPDGVPGYFSTVLGGPTLGQQAPVDLPLTVLSIVPDAGLAGSLLLVRLDLSNPQMARIGNIASGMSGSPVVVEDEGVAKVVGALSYGDIFTTDGLALATPIEDMLTVEGAGLRPPTDEAASTTRAITPLRVGDRTISRVTVGAPDTAAKLRAMASRSAADPGTAQFVPLMGMQIGGLPAASSAYRRLQRRIEGNGMRLLAPHGATVPGRSDFEPTMGPGASAGTFFSYGDLNVGGIGTVTYTTPDDGLVAFGHPLLWQGPSNAFLTSAWIDGVWSSSWGSYKLGSPAKAVGTLIQDRAAGVGALVGVTPVPVPVTGSATVTEGGRVVSRTGRTLVAPGTFATDMRSDLPAVAAIQPVLRAADVSVLPGSAKTTLTIVVSDGDEDYEINRTNLFDDGFDVLGSPASEVYDVMETILDAEDGTRQTTVESVDLVTEVTQARVGAAIGGIHSSGLRTGVNVVNVAVDPPGSTDEVLVPVRLTIPPGTPLSGTVVAKSGPAAEIPLDDSSTAVMVEQLESAPVNSDIVVEFRPGEQGEDDEEGEEEEGAQEQGSVVRGIARTAWVIEGEAEAATSSLSVEPSASPIVAGQTVTLEGSLSPAADGATVQVQRRTAGSSVWRTLAPALPVEFDEEEEEAVFQITDRPQWNSVYRVSYAGSGGTVLGSVATVGVGVRGKVALAGQRTRSGFVLTAALTPKLAGATVTFKRYVGGQWRVITAVKTDATGRARYVWPVKKGTYPVRAWLTGTAALAGNLSPTVRLHR